MANVVEYRHKLDVPLELVWTLLSDFTSILRWVPGGDNGRIAVRGAGIGMTRELDLPGTGKVQHRLDALAPAQHSVTYTVTKGRPPGVASHTVTVSLTGDEEHCIAHWRGMFVPTPGADPGEIEDFLVDAYREMSSGLAASLAHWQDHC